jgi:putative redox protein
MMIVNASAQWVDGERFVGQATSGHAIVVDADRERNTAPGPMELVLIGMCTCTATDVITILRKKRQPVTGLRVLATGERAKDPPTVYTSIHVTYEVVGAAVEQKAIEDAINLSQSKYCGASIMLGKTAKITWEIKRFDA